jgi:uncharacterized membrane protein YqjE
MIKYFLHKVILMVLMFEHTFQKALFATGALLFLIGLIFAIISGTASIEGGLEEAISYGFTAFFFSMFSGSLIGVGTAMAADSLILALRGNKAHVLAAFLLSILSLLLAVASLANPALANFHLFVFFFAGISASGAFMVSAAVFGFSALFHSFLEKRIGLQ